MNGTLDILTLIFLVLAVVIFIKLRSVLGRRTGHERPRYDPYRAEDANGSMPDNIVTLPRGETPQMSEELDQDTFAKRLKEVAPEGGAVATKLQDIAKIDRTFDPKHFMTGAKSAYEMIVTAFAEGDRRALKNLLSKEVYESFTNAIAEREERGESVEFKFVGISKAEITDAEVQIKTAHVTVKFTSDIITATLNRVGDVIEGSPSQIQEVIDFWTFSRDTTSRDPNWKLVATGAAS